MMRFLALSLMLFALPLGAGAHAFGVSHETTVDGVHIDIGYSSAAPVAGESVIFDFNLPVGEEDETYTDVWVRIDHEGGSTKLATAVYNAEFGGPRMSYVFPEAGTYTVSVRYENNGTPLVKTEWQLMVVPVRGGLLDSFGEYPWFAWFLVGVAAGMLLMIVRMRVMRAS